MYVGFGDFESRRDNFSPADEFREDADDDGVTGLGLAEEVTEDDDDDGVDKRRTSLLPRRMYAGFGDRGDVIACGGCDDDDVDDDVAGTTEDDDDDNLRTILLPRFPRRTYVGFGDRDGNDDDDDDEGTSANDKDRKGAAVEEED
jgi:hypothetical protein